MFRLLLGDPDLRLLLDRERVLAYRVDREVAYAEDGEALVRLARQARPHMIVLDADHLAAGLEPTVAHLRRTPTLKTTPLVVSAAHRDETERRLRGSGVDTVLPKPVLKSALYRLLRLLGPETGLDVRVAVGLDAECRAPGSSAAGRVVNLSTGGLFFATRTPAAVGTAVSLDLALPGFTGGTPVRALVRWVREARGADDAGRPGGVGLQFVDLSPAARKAIATYVALARDILRVV